MKHFFLGLFTMYVVQVALNFGWHNALDNAKDGKLYFRAIETLQGSPLVDVFTSRCTKDTMRGDIMRRDYFTCNKVQIFVSDIIYGE